MNRRSLLQFSNKESRELTILTLSHLEFIKLQHLLADVHEDHILLNDVDAPLSEFNPLTHQLACGDSCLHIAAWRSDLAAIKLLVQGGVEINAEGDNGYTPLDCALSKNSGDVVSYLIANGGVAHVCTGKVRKWIKDKIE